MISIIVLVVARTRLHCVDQFFSSALSAFDSETLDIFSFVFIVLCSFTVGYLLEVLLRLIVFGFYPTLEGRRITSRNSKALPSQNKVEVKKHPSSIKLYRVWNVKTIELPRLASDGRCRDPQGIPGDGVFLAKVSQAPDLIQELLI
jgi:hypothetical protein